MALIVLCVIGVLNIPIYLILGKAMFGGWEGFLESLFSLVRWDIEAAASGEHEEHQFGKINLAAYLIGCAAVVAGEYYVIAKYVLGMENPWNFN